MFSANSDMTTYRKDFYLFYLFKWKRATDMLQKWNNDSTAIPK